MPADKYFAYAAELLKLQPPHITDEPIIAQHEADRHRARQELRPRQAPTRPCSKALDRRARRRAQS